MICWSIPAPAQVHLAILLQKKIFDAYIPQCPFSDIYIYSQRAAALHCKSFNNYQLGCRSFANRCANPESLWAKTGRRADTEDPAGRPGLLSSKELGVAPGPLACRAAPAPGPPKTALPCAALCAFSSAALRRRLDVPVRLPRPGLCPLKRVFRVTSNASLSFAQLEQAQLSQLCGLRLSPARRPTGPGC